MKIALASLALAAAFAAAPALAQVPPPASQPTTQQACAADVKTYCGHVKPGPGNPLAACMRQNDAKLSAGCKAAIKRTQEQRAKPR